MSGHTMRKTMRECLTPIVGECASSIASLAVKLEGFEINVCLIQLVSQN